ncbi:hypothetical protein E3N88_22901 [Mikania micrantha]|uniref:non-specific serine/threonine protein kinase n=1 Tax=Mikania micrantha TaxID=192012 RepID=A0A5N6NDH4_9ASTR|nr:hypothetical protein E3N88_22901 [Mikania micrantha]
MASKHTVQITIATHFPIKLTANDLPISHPQWPIGPWSTLKRVYKQITEEKQKDLESANDPSTQGSLDEEQWGLVTWVQDSIKEGNLKNIIDSDIRGEISLKCLKEYVKLAERCLHNSPKHRPTMAEILFSLESVMAIQEKFNNSLQSASRTLFGRMVNLFPFSSNQENSVQGDLNLSTNSKGNNMFPHMKEVPAHFPSPSPILKEFRFSDLEKATRSFSPDLILGVGSFGNVFLGWVKENTLAPSKQGVGIAVAVKRLNEESVQGAAEWQAEVNFLGHLAHPNIIRLLGYCREELEHLLVYEYMPNKSFDCFLFSVIAEPLSWGTRLLIMMGAVCGMTHLHSNNIVSRGLKSSDILLDKDFNAKLGDFGLMRRCGSETGETHVSTRVMGTCGYGAPEYIRTGVSFDCKCDIYGLGMVLLESITGRRAMDAQRPKGQKSLVEWATRVGPNLKKIMDPRLEGSGSDFGGKSGTSYGFYGSVPVLAGKSDPSFPIQKKKVTPVFLRSKAHLHPRLNTFGVVRIRLLTSCALGQLIAEKYATALSDNTNAIDVNNCAVDVEVTATTEVLKDNDVVIAIGAKDAEFIADTLKYNNKISTLDLQGLDKYGVGRRQS